MRKLTCFISILFMILLLIACQTKPPEENYEESFHIEFDESLSSELGADIYGMRRYVMAILKSGPNRDMDETAAMQIQQAHLSNIRKLSEEGKLIVAGPFLDGGEMRGIYIFNVESIEEAKILTETDPAVQAGRLVMELHPWYGSAALQKVGDIHQRIAKENP